MLRIRLCNRRSTGVYQMLEQVELNSLDSTSDLNSVMVVIGKVLSKYVDTISDPNMVSALIDTSITTWTIRDLEAVQVQLSLNNMYLFVTDEQQLSQEVKQNEIIYLMIDSSIKVDGILPVGSFKVVMNEDSINLPNIISELLPTGYFDSNKFYNNPVSILLNNMVESRSLIGGVDNVSITKLYQILEIMNKQLIGIVQL